MADGRKKGRLYGARRVFGFLRPYALPYGFGMLMYGSQSFFFPLLNSWLLSSLTAAMLAGSMRQAWLGAGAFSLGMTLYLVMLGLGVYLYVRCYVRAVMDLKTALFRSFVQVGAEGGGKAGEGIAAINTEGELAVGVFNNEFAALLNCFITIVFTSLVLFGIDWRMGLVSIGVGLFSLLMQSAFSGPLAKIKDKGLAANARAVKEVSGMLTGAASIRAFNLQGRMLLAFDGHNKELRRLSLKEGVIALWQSFFTTIQGWLTLAGVFGVGGWLVATGRLSFALLMAVPTLCLSLAQVMSQLGQAWAAYQGPAAAANRVVQLIEAGEAALALSESKRRRERQWDGRYAIVLNGLGFSYPGSAGKALVDISLNIGQNEMVALVGESGSGKSTLLKVIAGFYQRPAVPMALGNLRYDDTPQDTWRRHFAYVDQSCKLFDLTIEENIALGSLKPAGPEQVREAAKAAMAAGFIEKLPQGYKSRCGEGGALLSGGQKQRIAIARALVRKSPVLVFDEATSALDEQSARQVMNAVEALRSTHTVLFATHDLAQVKSADRILVMKGGRIVEMGTHARLLALGGEYARLARAAGQAQ